MRGEAHELVGRAAEIGRAEYALARAATGAGGTLQVIGAAGAGTSSLLRAVGARAAEMGFTVVAIDVSEWERSFAWATLSAVVAPVRRFATELDEGAGRGLAPLISPGSGAPVEWFDVAMGALALLCRAATDRSLAILLDGVHHADEGSLAALSSIARRISADPILLVAAHDGTVDPPLPGEAVALGPLAEGDALELLTRVGVTDPQARRRILGAGDLLPGTLIDLTAELTDEQRRGLAALPDPLVAGGASERRWSARIDALCDRERTALLVVAAASSSDLGVVRRALEELGEVLGALASAEDAELIAIDGDEVRFTHPVVRSVSYYRSPPSVRRRIHAALASAELDPERAVWQRSRSVVGVDDEVAAAMEELAGRARQRGALPTACDLMRNAATLTSDPRQRVERFLRCAELALAAGMLQRARAELAEVPADSRDDPAIALAAAAVEARLAVLEGDLAGAITIAEQFVPVALADATDRRDSVAEIAFTVIGPAMSAGVWRAAVGLALQVASMLDDERPGLSAATRARASIARGIARRLSGDETTATDLDAWRDLAAIGGPAASVMLCETVAPVYLASNRKADATAMLDELEASARGAASPGALIPVLVARSAIAYAIDFAAAVRYADQAIGLAEETGQPGLARAAWQSLVLSLAAQLDVRRCREVVDVMLESQLTPAAALAALGKLELSLGDPASAVEIFEELGAKWAHQSRPFVYQSDLAEALIRLGRQDEIGPHLELLDGQAQAGSVWAGAQAHRLRALVADGDEANEHFELARQGFEANRNYYALALTELQWGERARRLRRRAQARALLESARATFERVGAFGWLPRVDRELAAAGASSVHATSAVATLTATELEIARRTTAGHSTRDIASQLFLSPRTVETHLSGVYRKLGVRNRSALAALARDEPALLSG